MFDNLKVFIKGLYEIPCMSNNLRLFSLDNILISDGFKNNFGSWVFLGINFNIFSATFIDKNSEIKFLFKVDKKINPSEFNIFDKDLNKFFLSFIDKCSKNSNRNTTSYFFLFFFK